VNILAIDFKFEHYAEGRIFESGSSEVTTSEDLGALSIDYAAEQGLEQY